MLPGKEWQVGLDQLHWLRAELDQAGRPEQPLLALADSAWQGAGVWRDLAARTTLLAGCRANRALYALPPAYTGRGRPRCYGERASRPDAWLALKPGWRRTTLVVRNRQIPVSYRVEGPYVVEGAPQQPLFLLVVRGSNSRRGKKRRRARSWLVNAVERDGRWVLPFGARTLLSWAWQRWEDRGHPSRAQDRLRGRPESVLECDQRLPDGAVAGGRLQSAGHRWLPLLGARSGTAATAGDVVARQWEMVVGPVAAGRAARTGAGGGLSASLARDAGQLVENGRLVDVAE
jgi:hypothetical protein